MCWAHVNLYVNKLYNINICKKINIIILIFFCLICKYRTVTNEIYIERKTTFGHFFCSLNNLELYLVSCIIIVKKKK